MSKMKTREELFKDYRIVEWKASSGKSVYYIKERALFLGFIPVWVWIKNMLGTRIKYHSFSEAKADVVSMVNNCVVEEKCHEVTDD